MYTKVFLSFLLYIFLVSQNVFSQSYYPTRIGNEWHYFEDVSFPFDSTQQGYTDSSKVKIIGDTLMSNDTTYFIVKPYDLLGGRYVFVDSNYVHYYDAENERDVAVLSLKGDVGEYREFPAFGDYNRSWIERIDTVEIFGDTTISIHFVVDGLIWTEVSLSEKYGMHYSYCPGEPSGTVEDSTYLIYCNLKGKSYGTPLTIEQNNQIIQTFSLYQNYPNPFNPSTNINFSLDYPSKVSLVLYNLLGQKILTIFSGNLDRGEHKKTLNSYNLPSGIYYYELRVGKNRLVKKCVVLK